MDDERRGCFVPPTRTVVSQLLSVSTECLLYGPSLRYHSCCQCPHTVPAVWSVIAVSQLLSVSTQSTCCMVSHCGITVAVSVHTQCLLYGPSLRYHSCCLCPHRVPAVWSVIAVSQLLSVSTQRACCMVSHCGITVAVSVHTQCLLYGPSLWYHSCCQCPHRVPAVWSVIAVSQLLSVSTQSACCMVSHCGITVAVCVHTEYLLYGQSLRYHSCCLCPHRVPAVWSVIVVSQLLSVSTQSACCMVSHCGITVAVCVHTECLLYGQSLWYHSCCLCPHRVPAVWSVIVVSQLLSVSTQRACCMVRHCGITVAVCVHTECLLYGQSLRYHSCCLCSHTVPAVWSVIAVSQLLSVSTQSACCMVSHCGITVAVCVHTECLLYGQSLWYHSCCLCSHRVPAVWSVIVVSQLLSVSTQSACCMVSHCGITVAVSVHTECLLYGQSLWYHSCCLCSHRVPAVWSVIVVSQLLSVSTQRACCMVSHCGITVAVSVHTECLLYGQSLWYHSCCLCPHSVPAVWSVIVVSQLLSVSTQSACCMVSHCGITVAVCVHTECLLYGQSLRYHSCCLCSHRVPAVWSVIAVSQLLSVFTQSACCMVSHCGITVAVCVHTACLLYGQSLWYHSCCLCSHRVPAVWSVIVVSQLLSVFTQSACCMVSHCGITVAVCVHTECLL